MKIDLPTTCHHGQLTTASSGIPASGTTLNAAAHVHSQPLWRRQLRAKNRELRSRRSRSTNWSAFTTPSRVIASMATDRFWLRPALLASERFSSKRYSATRSQASPGIRPIIDSSSLRTSARYACASGASPRSFKTQARYQDCTDVLLDRSLSARPLGLFRDAHVLSGTGPCVH